MSDPPVSERSSVGSRPVQFAPFSSALDAGFWHKLTQLILDVYGLDETLRDINGYYTNYDADGIPPHLNVDYAAFKESFETPFRCFRSHGHLKKTNTIEQFKNCDKNSLLEAEGNIVWDDIRSGRAIEDPSLLSRFLLLTYADLKKYHYYYWFAFPAVTPPSSLGAPQAAGYTVRTNPRTLSQRFTDQQIVSLTAAYDKICLPAGVSTFLVKTAGGEVEEGETLEVGLLSHFNQLSSSLEQKPASKLMLAFCDSSTIESYPGWPLRNLLALAVYHWSSYFETQGGGGEMEVLCWRDRFKDGVRQVQHSIILNICLPPSSGVAGESSSSPPHLASPPKFVGWEKNEKQKLGPRMVNLSASMDPAKLAESAVDLNLKLMRWRLLPSLNLELISGTKCLLMGAGTLGCNVARCLMGWGVRNITLVDNSTVSYSNPVRQSLFQFEDSLNGGRPKAETAAEALKRIFPGVNAVGVNLSIPMPGHMIPDNLVESTQKDVQRLESLIDSHDVIILLMDTRESRWLPTLIGKTKHKIVLSSALGFDTYLVVRHGMRKGTEFASPSANQMREGDGASASSSGSGRSEDGKGGQEGGFWSKSISGTDLGCYFCNDVVAPGDSTRDRTLDQQCTVSRPGLSMMAAALTVELVVSLIVHPQRGEASADTISNDCHLGQNTESPLGVVPHQIRGFLSMFHHMLPASFSFDRCTACSPKVLEAYEKEGFEFLLKVFNLPSYVEDLTGLTELHADTEALDDMCFMSDEDAD